MASLKSVDANPQGTLEYRKGQAQVIKKAHTIRSAVKEHAERGNGLTIHGRPEVLLDPMFYPEHDQRTESPGYAKVHKKLTVDDDRPCLVCGVKNSILKNEKTKKDPALNPFGAIQMETHHHVVEWALANAVDPKNFNKAIRPNLAGRHPDQAMYKRDMTEQEILDWVDHSADNLWVLCDVHHRHKWVGIHHVSYPMWAPQDLLKPEFIDAVAKAEAEADAANQKAPNP